MSKRFKKWSCPYVVFKHGNFVCRTKIAFISFPNRRLQLRQSIFRAFNGVTIDSSSGTFCQSGEVSDVLVNRFEIVWMLWGILKLWDHIFILFFMLGFSKGIAIHWKKGVADPMSRLRGLGSRLPDPRSKLRGPGSRSSCPATTLITTIRNDIRHRFRLWIFLRNTPAFGAPKSVADSNQRFLVEAWNLLPSFGSFPSKIFYYVAWFRLPDKIKGKFRPLRRLFVFCSLKKILDFLLEILLFGLYHLQERRQALFMGSIDPYPLAPLPPKTSKPWKIS